VGLVSLPPPELDPLLATNRANWDARVPAHLGPGGYEVDRYVADPDRISEVVAFDRPRLGDLRDKRVVHLQCHIGTDTISLARLGAADVVGIDFSEPALAAARNLAAETGDNARFVLADVYRAAAAAGDSFDVLYTSVGTICWLDNIERWAGNVAGLLRPGGRFVFRDLHPTMWVYEEIEGQIVPHYQYWQAPDTPVESVETQSYAGDQAIASPRTYEWNHTIAEVLNALIDAGMRIDHLDEHPGCDWQLFPSATANGSQYFLPEDLRDKLPVCWSITATRA
jgi:SAM-dependent methyltransferase